MNQLEMLNAMAKAGFTFGRDDEGKPYLVHTELYESLNKWTACLWGDRLFYQFAKHGEHGRMILWIEGFEDMHHVYFEDDELDVDRIISGVIHMYSWIP